MENYQELAELCRKNQRAGWKIKLITFVILGLASLWVWLDLIKLSPWIIYGLGLGITLFLAQKIRIKSPYYEDLVAFLKLQQARILKDRQLVLFIDYHLTQHYPAQYKELRAYMAVPKKERSAVAYLNLENLILVSQSYYEFLTLNQVTGENFHAKEHRSQVVARELN